MRHPRVKTPKAAKTPKPKAQGQIAKAWGAKQYSALIVVCAVIISFGIGYGISVLGGAAAPGTTTTTTTTSTTGTVTVVDWFSGVKRVDGNCTIYGRNTTDLTSTQIDEGLFADFSVVGSTDNGSITWDIEDNYVYFARSQTSGCNEVFQVVGAGSTSIKNMVQATDVNILAWSETLNTTVANATERDWTVLLQMIDSDSAANSTVGFLPVADFSVSGTEWADFGVYNTFPILNCTFYATPIETDVSVENWSNSKTVASNSILVKGSTPIYGTTYLTTKFGGRMATVAPKTLAFAHGTLSTATEYDSQA